MGLTELRDLILIIFGLLASGLIIFLIVFAALTYRKASSILDSVRQTIAEFRRTSSAISESIIQPTAKLYGFISGVRRAVEVLETIRSKDKEEKGGEGKEQR